ncbi:MAG: asparaginase [Chloroflexi bacterium]|nr:asparaginase [Chloroflexota bacterium]
MPERDVELSEVIVEVVRGPLVEAMHRGTLAVVDASGELLASVGDPRRKITYMRSAAKPFQSMPLVMSGAASRYGLAPADIAIASSSHNAEPRHVEQVRSLLSHLDVDPGQLACGSHPPLLASAAQDLERQGIVPTVLHNNCSGLHAGMLGLASQLGAATTGYQLMDHPVQVAIVANIARFAGLKPADVILAQDDCVSPCHGLSVYHMALAYARLMLPGGQFDDETVAAARTIREAMTGNAWLIAGSGRLDTDLMEAGAGQIVAKGGASGVQCVGLAGGIGLALKIDDGASGPAAPGQPTAVSTVEALRQLGILDPARSEVLGRHARPALRNRHGEETGYARPALDLGSVAADAVASRRVGFAAP